MAFGVASIFEVQSSGSDTANGGGFDPGATMSTDLAATSATGTAPVVTSATYNFVANDVGKYLFIKSGTNWLPGWYLIASVASNAATLTATIGSVIRYRSETQLNIVAGCATTASPTTGTWSVDYSRDNTPFISFTDMVIGATTTQFTSVANPAGPNWIGNFIRVTSGTGFTVQRVEVTAFTAAGLIATCDKSLGTTASTGGNGGLGGALATPGLASTFSQNSGGAFVKGSATYSMANSTGAGGKWTGAGFICGYSTTRALYNHDANLPVIQSSANGMTLITSGAPTQVSSLVIANGNANTTVDGITDPSANVINAYNVKVTGIRTAIQIYQNTICQYCSAINCTSNTPINSAGGGNKFIDCVISGGGGFAGGNITSVIIRCIVAGNTTAVVDFDSFGLADHCVSYGHTGATACFFNIDWVFNCVISGQSHASGSGIGNAQGGSSNFLWYILNNAFYNNVLDTNISGTGQQQAGRIVLTADPFTNAAGGDFSLNNTAGGGALLRALAFPTSYLGISTTQALDVGAAQHTAIPGATSFAF